jgi:DNA-binding XRE family transcriptional regulator
MVEGVDPTCAERLMADRRRSGKTQAELAADLGIPLHVYGDIERGRIAPDRTVAALAAIELTLPEKLTALRRRLGITQRIAAAELGVCRMTAASMEEGKTDPAPLMALLQTRAGLE